MGKMGNAMGMSGGSRAGGNPVLMALVALLIALPGLAVEATSPRAPVASDLPPTLDGFLVRVSAATPPDARILVAGAPPAVVFYRATLRLYPRRVSSALPTDYAHASAAPRVRWSGLARQARLLRARYVLLWDLPLATPPTALVHAGAGALIEVRS